MFYEPDRRAVASSNFPEQVWLKVPLRKSKLKNPYEGPYRVLSSRPPNYIIDYRGSERTVHITQVKPVSKPKMVRPSHVIVDDDDESMPDGEATGPALDNIEIEQYDVFQDVPQPVPRLATPETHQYPYRIRRGSNDMATRIAA